MKSQAIEYLATEYFKAFSEGNLEKLENLYAEDVTLKDWASEHKGRGAVLAANKALFSSQEVDVKVNSMVGGDFPELTVVCEIEIFLDDGSTKEHLLVADVLVFNELGQIEEIRAYLGSN